MSLVATPAMHYISIYANAWLWLQDTLADHQKARPGQDLRAERDLGGSERRCHCSINTWRTTDRSIAGLNGFAKNPTRRSPTKRAITSSPL
jgi:hypothetical protein